MGWNAVKKEEKVPEVKLEPTMFFKKASEMPKKKGLKIGVWGPTGIGKTYFGLSMPPPVYVLDNDLAAQKVYVENFANKDVHIYECTVLDPLTDKPDPIKSLLNFEQAVISLKDVNEGTIVVDTVHDYWVWMAAYVEQQAKRFIKESGQMMRTEWQAGNTRYRYFILRLLVKPMHVVLVGKEKSKYSSKGEELDAKEADWQKETATWCDIVLSMQKGMMPGNPPKPAFVATFEKNRFKRTDKILYDVTWDKLLAYLKEQKIAAVEGM